MSFLNPFALLAMAAVAVPLVLHFFNLRQPKTVDFSSLAFVKAVQESSVQRVRIKEWLLLALRMLAIACLVMAFARPTLTGDLAEIGGPARTARGLVVDNSLSMGVDARVGGTALAEAKQRLQSVLDLADGDDEAVVQPVAAGDAPPPRPSSASRAREALSPLEPRPGATSLARGIARAAERVDTSTAPRKVVYAASDLQRSTLGDSVSQQPPGRDDVQVRLLPVPPRETPNVSVADVSVDSRIAEAGQPLQFDATLVNHGPDPRPNAVASVYLGDERVAQTTVTLAPGQETTVSFTATPRERGWLGGRVETEGDGFPPDDRHHFALHVPDERRVLVARGAGQEMRYVDLALSSEMIADRIAFRTASIDTDALATTDLGQYEAVLLVGPRTLSEQAVEALARYVDRGGGILFFPSRQARSDDYDALFDALGIGQLDGFVGTPSGEQSVASFSRVDLEHPLFEGVFDRAGSPDDAEVEQPDIYYAMRLRPSGRSGQTLIELSNGAPFLHEVRRGSGAVLLSAVAPSLEWSDLPTRGLFVPLLYRSVYYLSAGASVTGEQLLAGQPGEVRVPGVPPDAALRLVGPEGTERVPDQRTLFGATLLQTGAELRTPGVYDVRADGRLVRRFAVNVSPAESDLRTHPPDSAATLLQSALDVPVEVLSAETDEAVAETLRTRRAGTEIWNVFLGLALVFLVGEMLVASQWRPETAGA